MDNGDRPAPISEHEMQRERGREGQARSSAAPEATETTPQPEGSKQRIINGYEPEERRPWMVLLNINSADVVNPFRCGGKRGKNLHMDCFRGLGKYCTYQLPSSTGAFF